MVQRSLPASFIVPAQPVERLAPPAGPDWIHEIKRRLSAPRPLRRSGVAPIHAPRHRLVEALSRGHDGGLSAEGKEFHDRRRGGDLRARLPIAVRRTAPARQGRRRPPEGIVSKRASMRPIDQGATRLGSSVRTQLRLRCSEHAVRIGMTSLGSRSFCKATSRPARRVGPNLLRCAARKRDNWQNTVSAPCLHRRRFKLKLVQRAVP
jgi:hypothetical protein